MARKITAIFASSFLSVALTIPAQAEEKGGVVAFVDREAALLTLADGTTYVLPGAIDYDAIQPGMEVHVILDEASSDPAAA